jgi:prepilin-type N-terminal cleavage/methylation domain-containing protein
MRFSTTPAGSRSQAGFSMIEVMVSAIIVGLIGTSAFYFLTSQNSAGAKGGDMMKGVNAGKLKMDSLKVVSYDQLASGSDTVSERFIRTWHVSRQYDGAGKPIGQKTIEVAVYWPLTGEQSVSFTSVKTDDKYKEDGP